MNISLQTVTKTKNNHQCPSFPAKVGTFQFLISYNRRVLTIRDTRALLSLYYIPDLAALLPAYKIILYHAIGQTLLYKNILYVNISNFLKKKYFYYEITERH